jgi:hypothetical protein
MATSRKARDAAQNTPSENALINVKDRLRGKGSAATKLGFIRTNVDPIDYVSVLGEVRANTLSVTSRPRC